MDIGQKQLLPAEELYCSVEVRYGNESDQTEIQGPLEGVKNGFENPRCQGVESATDRHLPGSTDSVSGRMRKVPKFV